MLNALLTLFSANDGLTRCKHTVSPRSVRSRIFGESGSSWADAEPGGAAPVRSRYPLSFCIMGMGRWKIRVHLAGATIPELREYHFWYGTASDNREGVLVISWRHGEFLKVLSG